MLMLLQPSFVHSRTRRKGQALILAVFVMLFAVLLSSAFLVVIGNNGRQVGRETDRAEASRNADKGVAFVVARLRAVPNPDVWNAATDSVVASGGVPNASNVDYDLYYSELDKALGWSTQGFAKYPDPRRSRQAPQFLVSSHFLGTSTTDDADGGDKRFMLRITVIGLSSKNPEAWSRRVLYKTTNWNKGTFSYSNFVTSFDPDTQKSITSTLANSATVPVASNPALNSDLVLPIYAAKGQGNERVMYSPRIADIGNTLMVSDGQHQPLVGVVKNATLSNSVYSVTVRVLQAAPVTATLVPFLNNAKVSLVGSLFELPSQIDESGDQNGVPTSTEGFTQEQRLIGVSGASTPSTAPFGNGAQFNNGMSVPTTTTFAGRPPVAPSMGSQTFAGQNMLSSTGPISIGDPSPTPTGTPLALQFSNATNTTQIAAITQATPQAVPSENQFLSISFDPSGAAQKLTANSAVAPVIEPRFIKPAPIDFASYRAKAVASGLYISNADDVEKFNGQPLTTSQLQRFWQRKSFKSGDSTKPFTNGNVAAGQTGAIGPGTDAARLCYGRPGTGGDSYIYPMPTGSLEQRGIRGWISPWEFLPRGAQIILNGTTLTVIQDPLSDNSTSAPDLNKAFNAATRQFSLTGTPTNGIICADGNVRVRGTWTGTPLSIVSGGNIYIEGNLKTPIVTPPANTSRIALLAKKNVVLNPTQFVSRPIGTVDTSVGQNSFTAKVLSGGIQEATGKTLTAKTFKLGDKVAVFKQGLKSDGWHEVTGFDNGVNPTSIQFTPVLDTTNFPDGTDVKIKLACDPSIVLLQTANKANGTGADDIPATEHFIAGGDGKEANTQELDLKTNPASAGSSYAYKFAVGGDTLVRTVPFSDKNGAAVTVGVAFNQAAQKSIVKFTVRGGDDKDPTTPDPAKEDDGARQISLRPALPTKIDLTLKPKPGDINGQETFDLQDANQDGSVASTEGDGTITLDALNSFFLTRAADADREKSRWRIEDVKDSMNVVTKTGLLPTRRLAQGDMTFSITPPNSKQDNTEEAPNEPTKFRVPLTSSVVLFSGSLALGTTAPEDATPIYRVGSAFGFRANSITPTTDEDQNTVKNSFYGTTPQWSIPTDSTPDNSITYTSNSSSGDFAFTRDGSGDYDDSLPTYYLSGMHFQRVSGTGSIAPAPADSTVPDRDIKANMTIEVDATIYAEGGSWFVVPIPATIPANAGLGADQQIEWRRPAYNVTINGNITQMMTPSATFDYDDEPDSDGVATGAMKRWTDTLSYQVYNTANAAQPLWQTIRYNAAPLPAIDTTTATGFAALPQLPSSPDILYTYSN
ncbi:hypothetical protein IAD21_05220 [Abditibacteriota bacterium]|nr:hypothetical protein IAD21_05220 [Abditibacteriota bacterium]